MKKRRRRGLKILAVIVGVALLAFGAYELAHFQIGQKVRFSVDSVSVEIDSMRPNMAEAVVHLSVYNFLPFNVPFDSISYRVTIDDTVYAAGSQNDRFVIESKSVQVGTFPIEVDLEQLSQHLAREGPAKLDTRFRIFLDIPLLGSVPVTFGPQTTLRDRQQAVLAVDTLDVLVQGTENPIVNMDLLLDIQRSLKPGTLIDSMELAIFIDQTPYIKVDLNEPLSISGQANVVRLPATIALGDLRKELKARLEVDSMWINARGFAHITFPNRNTLLVRYNIDRQNWAPKPPQISILNWEMAKFGIDSTKLLIALRIYNGNPFGLTFNSMRYQLYLNGNPVAQEVMTETQRVDSFGVDTLVLPVKFDPLAIGWGALKMLLFDSKPSFSLVAQTDAVSDVGAVDTVRLNLVIRGKLDPKSLGNGNGNGNFSFERLMDEIAETDQKQEVTVEDQEAVVEEE